MVFPATVDDYRRLARRRLPGFVFDYVDGGSGDELTLAANTSAWHAFKLQQRVLVDVAHADTSTTLAGTAAKLPVALAPVGLAGLVARRGEVQAARMAQAAGVPFTLSTVGVCSIEEVGAATQAPFWYQLYMLGDRGAVTALLDRAWAAGCRTLAFTVDLPVMGLRHRDVRHGTQAHGAGPAWHKLTQVLTRPHWLIDVAMRGKPLTFGTLAGQVPDARNLNELKAWVDAQMDATVTWRDIEWLRGYWQGKLLLKGILDPRDARAAADAGVDGVVVSNHGGRQLDGVGATAQVLPAIVDAVGERIEVLVDGGIRSGADVFKALALGARGVLLGRPWVFALAGGGAAGVAHMLDTLRRELEITMQLTGVTKVSQITSQCLDRLPDGARDPRREQS